VEPGLIETAFGDVLSEALLTRPGSGAYKKLVQGVAKSTRDAYAKGRGSDPGVIAEVVSKAVKAKNPRTRYAAGKYADLMLFMRKWLGDRTFDRVMMSQMG
jgi:hypothetical protein